MELPPLRRPLPHEVFYPSPVNRRWIAAQRNLRDLESQAREHLRDYQSAIAELESVAGVELEAITEHNPKTTAANKITHP